MCLSTKPLYTASTVSLERRQKKINRLIARLMRLESRIDEQLWIRRRRR